MKCIILSIITIVLCASGCSSEGTPSSVPQTDGHPTSILGIKSGGLSFDTDHAFAILSPGDTVWHEITALDQDGLVSYRIIHVNNTEGTIVPYAPNDTLVARFGFVADTAVFKTMSVLRQSVIFTDALGFTKKAGIELYIKR